MGRIVPVLTGEAAKDFLNTLNSSKLKPYTDEERTTTDKEILSYLKEKLNNTAE